MSAAGDAYRDGWERAFGEPQRKRDEQWRKWVDEVDKKIAAAQAKADARLWAVYWGVR